jgi:Flp pilus assembly CpaF family ATPase
MSNDLSDVKKQHIIDSLRKLAAEADKGREPELIATRQGTRQVSLRALIERIVDQFRDEHGHNESDALKQAQTEMARLKLVKASADYVIAVDSVELDNKAKAEIIRRAYAELFTYGPLDALFREPAVTTITLEGADKAAIRLGSGDLVRLDPLFDDEAHYRRIVSRLLADAGAQLREDQPLLETGLIVNGRRVSLNVAGPPVTILLSVDIRVHPAEPYTLEDMVTASMVTPEAATILQALAQSPHGVVVVGDTESGKTTLLGILARLAEPESCVAVERASEIMLDDCERLAVRWRTDDQLGVSFAEQVEIGLRHEPGLILLDEVRTDEAHAVGPLLTQADTPRQMWAFRGPSEPKRLASALGMLARRATLPMNEDLVHALYQRLPFIVTLRRRKGKILLQSISEWQYPDGAEYPDQVELIAMGWFGPELTGRQPQLALDLPASFWEKPATE